MNSVWEMMIPGVCGFGLHIQLDGFRLAYTLMAVLMWAVSGVFSLEYMAHYAQRRRYYVFFWITFLATVGVFLSADLYTTFIFFEIMSLTSYVWVAFDEKKESLRAAETYLAVAIIGGMVMLMGLFLLADCLGTLEIKAVAPAAVSAVQRGEKGRLYAAGGLLLFGFGAKAGAFPLHIWLPKAHPVAPAPASALLSGILTKTGIFGIIVVSMQIFAADGFWGLLITGLGLITMFTGAFLALFSINLKRTLACSSVSQIGFILVGIGMCVLLSFAGENPAIAARGAFLHMVNHSLFKLVLFLCAGAVYMKLHQLDINEIRGYGRKKPVLAFCFLMGAVGISGIPGWSGYISKTLLHESMVEYQHILSGGEWPEALRQSAAGTGGLPLVGNAAFWSAAEWVFLLTGGMTFAYMLKLFIAIFIERHPTRQAEYDQMGSGYMRTSSKAVLLLPAVLLPLMGLFPALTMDRLADCGQWFFLTSSSAPGSYSAICRGTLNEGMKHATAYFHWENLKGGMISIGIGILLYFGVVRQLLMARTAGQEEAGQHGTRQKYGEKYYVNRWPEALDLEHLLYRPVLQVFLPGVMGTVCGFIDRYSISVPVNIALGISSVCCRAMDHLADGIILLARRTTHRQINETGTLPSGHWLLRKLGRIWDMGNWVKILLSGKRKEVLQANGGRMPSKVPELIAREEQLTKTGRLVEESFSFGLMLFCIGLCFTLGYLFYVFFRG